MNKKHTSVVDMVEDICGEEFANEFKDSLPFHRLVVQIASSLSKVMVEKNITVKKLAKALKVRKRRVKDYLRGDRLTIEIIANICVILEVVPTMIFENLEKKNRCGECLKELPEDHTEINGTPKGPICDKCVEEQNTGDDVEEKAAKKEFKKREKAARKELVSIIVASEMSHD